MIKSVVFGVLKVEEAIHNLYRWKSHVIRCRNQERAQDELVKTMTTSDAVITCDWAMKFLPRKELINSVCIVFWIIIFSALHENVNFLKIIWSWLNLIYWYMWVEHCNIQNNLTKIFTYSISGQVDWFAKRGINWHIADKKRVGVFLHNTCTHFWNSYIAGRINNITDPGRCCYHHRIN